jgi:hypothetical protein
LSYVILYHANLTRVDLSFAQLSYTNLRDADLSFSNLKYADLREADLRYADLRFAILHNADLRNADLSYADLRHADLRESNFEGVNFDFSAFPLWCGSLGIEVDEKFAMQLAYHFCSLKCDSAKFISLRKQMIDFANKFHRVGSDCPALLK